MKNKTICIVICALLIGCARTKVVWNHPSKDAQLFYRESAVCESMANSAGNPQIVYPSGGGAFMDGFARGRNIRAAEDAQESRQRIFNNCMMGEGWIPSYNK